MNENDPDSRRLTPNPSAEARAEVGAALRAARLKRGQTLEAAAQQTRIPKRSLEALEGGRLDDFPAFVYMRGFLQAYCDHLDLPFAELWAKVAPPAEPASSSAPTVASSAPSHGAPDEPPASSAPERGPARDSSSALGAILFALALAAGLAVRMFHEKRPATPAASAPSTPRALLPATRPVENKVVLRAVDDAWVRVSVDGDVVFEGRIPRGAAMDWKPARSFSLRTTAAPSVQVSVNGTPRALANPAPDGEYRVDLP